MAGKTFRYTEAGPEGLAKGKKLVVIETRAGNIRKGLLTQWSTLSVTFALSLDFLGVTDIEHVVAEGLNWHPEQASELMQAGSERAAQVAHTF